MSRAIKYISGSQDIRTARITPTVSISMTVLNAFSEIPDIGARKFPAAPSVSSETIQTCNYIKSDVPQITKSILPNSSIVFFAAACSCAGTRTSPCRGRHFWPVFCDISLADASRRSNLNAFSGETRCPEESLTCGLQWLHARHTSSRYQVE
jgi:hypothetical protein